LYTVAAEKTRLDLWVLPMEGDSKPFPFLTTEFSESQGAFSPDGRWVAYVSGESGRNEVYVRAFSPPGRPAAEGKWMVSRDGGTTPRWLADGKELTYFFGGRVMAVDVTAIPSFQAGAPRPPTEAPLGAAFGDAAADGKRYLVGVPVERTTAPPPFNVVLNWQAALKR
jgi:Tol biopolymer transport system component